MVRRDLDVHPLFDVETQAVSDEFLAFVGYDALLGVGEVHHAGLKHYAFVEDTHLAHLVAEGLLSE